MNNTLKPSDTQISVVIPVYGNPEYLREAIASAMNQAVPPAEIVVVDDGSPEPLHAAIGDLTSAVRFVRKEHSGIAATRNRDVTEARGDWILWLDSDDVLLPDTIRHYLDVLDRHPDAEVIYGDLLIVDAVLQNPRRHPHQDWYRRNRELVAMMLVGNPIPNPGTMVRRSLYNRYGNYDETLPRSEDYDWWARAAKDAVFKHCGAVTLKWRWHERDLKSGKAGGEDSCDAIVVQRLVERYPLDSLFPSLPWDDAHRRGSEAAGFIQIADRLLKLGAREAGLKFVELAYASDPSPQLEEIIRQLRPTARDQESRIKTKESRIIGQQSGIPDSKLKTQNSKLRRILLAAQQFPPLSYAGTEIYTFNLARELQSRGHKVWALHAIHNAKLSNGELVVGEYEGIALLQININPFPDLVGLFKNDSLRGPFKKALDMVRPDVVHFQHLERLGGESLLATHEAGLPTLLTIHDTFMLCEQPHLVLADGGYCDKGPETVDKCAHCFIARAKRPIPDGMTPEVFKYIALRRFYLQKALKWADTVIVPTHFINRMFRENGLDHPRMLVEPLGLPPMPFAEHRPRRDRLRLTFLGNIFPTKGLDILTEALNQIGPEGWELNIYGKIHDFAHYERSMNRLPAGALAHYRDAYTPTQLPKIFAETDVTVVSSRAENFPTVIRESFQAGVAVIAPAVGGIPEMIQDGVNGLLFKLGDMADLAAKMRFLINDPAQAQMLASRITPPRSISADADRLEDIYAETILSKKVSVQAVPTVV